MRIAALQPDNCAVLPVANKATQLHESNSTKIKQKKNHKNQQGAEMFFTEPAA
jgi:hypothetical protein